MLRVLLIIALAILLLPGPHSGKDWPTTPGTLLVEARPLPLSSADPGLKQADRLDYLGGWELTSAHKDFGGMSSLLLTADGAMLGLSDSGTLMGFRIDGKEDRQFIAPLPTRASERDWPNWKWDSESMVHDPASGRYWVGFELIWRICRYSPGFSRVEACREWPELKAWPKTGGAEAMVRLPSGRFLVFSELGYGQGGGLDVLLFDGDPAEKLTPSPVHLNYRPPQGFRPTDAVAIDETRLLLLNRRVALYQGFTASIALVEVPSLKAGITLTGREIARLAPPLLADNFEAMALSKEAGRSILWIASDDNHNFFQRTLLLKFALPADIAGR